MVSFAVRSLVCLTWSSVGVADTTIGFLTSRRTKQCGHPGTGTRPVDPTPTLRDTFIFPHTKNREKEVVNFGEKNSPPHSPWVLVSFWCEVCEVAVGKGRPKTDDRDAPYRVQLVERNPMVVSASRSDPDSRRGR